MPNTGDANSHRPLRKVPVAWEALEDAFENNAPEVHSYLNLATGEVVRIVDGVADPQMHARIVQDAEYLRVDPVSSREQYRWMERFIATVDEPVLRQALVQSIDGKGAFRRFKDALVGNAVERERWFAFRSERLRTAMNTWLAAHDVEAIERPQWTVPTADEVRAPVVEAPARPAKARPGVDVQRATAHSILDAFGPRDLEAALAFLEFLRERRVSIRARGFAAVAPSSSETSLEPSSEIALDARASSGEGSGE